MTNTKRPRDLEDGEREVFDDVQRRMARFVEREGACPALQRLLDAHAGHLPHAETRSVMAHLSACPMCQALVEALADPALGEPGAEEARRIDARVRAAARGAGPGRVPAWRARWQVGALAALATAATVLVVLGPGTSTELPALPALASTPMVRAVAPLAPSILVAERLDTSGMGLAAVAWRGDAAGRVPASAFDTAREAFDRGDFSEAVGRLRTVTDQTPSFADAWLLLGVSRLLLGQAAEAVAPLERARAALIGPAQQDATWHLAVALHAAGRDEDALVTLDSLCGERTGRAAMACLALDQLRAP